MRKKKTTRSRGKPAALSSEQSLSGSNGRQELADAAALMSAMAARGRAHRRQVEADARPPGEGAEHNPAWQAEWDELLARVRRGLPDDLTPEEVEAEITRVSDAVRNERLARGR